MLRTSERPPQSPKRALITCVDVKLFYGGILRVIWVFLPFSFQNLQFEKYEWAKSRRSDAPLYGAPPGFQESERLINGTAPDPWRR